MDGGPLAVDNHADDAAIDEIEDCNEPRHGFSDRLMTSRSLCSRHQLLRSCEFKHGVRIKGCHQRLDVAFLARRVASVDHSLNRFTIRHRKLPKTSGDRANYHSV
ncbi:MAG TPA: hypothetical protein VGO01_16650 [Bradyrhizobium sp.]|jgi:hypothetical protein|nr:hypothetical protein [Bradyrhizobium sp.]